MPAYQRQLKPNAAPSRNTFKLRTLDTALLDCFRLKFRSFARPESDHRSFRNLRETRHPLVIRIQHGSRIWPRKIFDQFALSQSNFLERREKLQMLHCNARDNTNIRPTNSRELCEFSGMRHPQLYNCRIVFITEL